MSKMQSDLSALFDKRAEIVFIVCLFGSLTSCWIADEHYDYKLAALECSADG